MSYFDNNLIVCFIVLLITVVFLAVVLGLLKLYFYVSNKKRNKKLEELKQLEEQKRLEEKQEGLEKQDELEKQEELEKQDELVNQEELEGLILSPYEEDVQADEPLEDIEASGQAGNVQDSGMAENGDGLKAAGGSKQALIGSKKLVDASKRKKPIHIKLSDRLPVISRTGVPVIWIGSALTSFFVGGNGVSNLKHNLGFGWAELIFAILLFGFMSYWSIASIKHRK